MKAAYIEQTGPPENIQYGELPRPPVTATGVLVRMTAVCINPIDTYIRNGANYWPLPQPFVVGCDLAGVVEEVGTDVRRFRVGDRVWGSNQGVLGRQGTFAEYACVDEHWLYPIPPGVDDRSAAACALVGITAHLGLFARGRIRAGETIFVRGGSGGVGSMVVQMAKIAGARVITTAGNADKRQICESLGADAVISYHDTQVTERVRELAPQGVDLFWETLRQPDVEQMVELLAENGRGILMAGRDARPPFPVGPFYVKGCSLHGFVMFKATARQQQVCADNINQWLESGRLRARIDRVFPLSQTAAAHRLQESSTVQQSGGLAGKIVLVPE